MNTKRLIVMAAAMLLITATALAQVGRGGSIGSSIRGRSVETGRTSLFDRGEAQAPVRSFVENKDLRTSDRWEADTVCYRHVRRVNSWLVGQGEPLPKDSLRGDAPFFRLTRRTPAGHYLRAEYVGRGRGQEPAEFRSLLSVASDSYDYADRERSDLRLYLDGHSDIVRMDFVPSADGERVQMELAYARDGRQVHVLTLERIDSDRAVGFYMKPDGDLLTLTDADRYVGPTGVVIEYDAEGGYRSITPIDSEAWPIARK